MRKEVRSCPLRLSGYNYLLTHAPAKYRGEHSTEPDLLRMKGDSMEHSDYSNSENTIWPFSCGMVAAILI
jgi:hypothetical protein